MNRTTDHRIADFKAVLFDLDGTLVDTMPLHFRAYALAFAQFGVDLSEGDYLAAVGGPASVAIPRMAAPSGFINDAAFDPLAIHALKKSAFAKILAAAPPRALPAAQFIEIARSSGAQVAVVSSGNRAGVFAIIGAMGWMPRFDTIVTADDVIAGKPDPEPFVLAATRLGLMPADCVVFEDTTDGMESARRAGMAAIDVATLVDS